MPLTLIEFTFSINHSSMNRPNAINNSMVWTVKQLYLIVITYYVKEDNNINNYINYNNI
jgi:hypothetical protein